MRRTVLVLFGAAFFALVATPALAAMKTGSPAPSYDLPCTASQRATSKRFESSPLSVVLFLKLDSEASLRMANALSELAASSPESDLHLVGISGNSLAELQRHAKEAGISFPLCEDSSGETLAAYDAAYVAPIVYVVGPEGRVLKKMAGASAGIENLVVSIAEKELARGRNEVVEVLTADIQEGESATQARTLEGYALLRQGKVERARDAFQTVSELSADGARMGETGLAEVAFSQGDLDGAEQHARKAGSSPHADVILSRVARRKGKDAEARRLLDGATEKPGDFAWQEALALNELARVVETTPGKEQDALDLYEKAVDRDRAFAEARTNQALARERAGDGDGAKKALATAERLAPKNELVSTLYADRKRRYESRSNEKRDRIDRLVGELAAAYRSGTLPKGSDDEWSPRPVVVSFIGLSDATGPEMPAGVSEGLQIALSDALASTGRFRVVDRELLDDLLAELRLGSSELADPTTRLRLGKILSASVIATGGLYPAPGRGAEWKLRLIDTETTELRSTDTVSVERPDRIAAAATSLANEIAPKLARKYPLKGKIADVSGGEILIGIGAKHGAKPGMRFAVVEEGEPVRLDGKILGRRKKTVGVISIDGVEEGFSSARVVEGSGFKSGQKLVEETA